VTFASFTVDTATPPAAVAQADPSPDRIAKLVQAMQVLARSQHARYDAAQNSDEFKNYWVNADGFDADSAHSPAVRGNLVKRARYEVANNGYSDGIAQTYATDLVGVGPVLRMQTGSKNFNQLVERTWYAWSQAVQFRRKLWCMAHAKGVDGEAFAVLRRNPRLNHPLKLDVVLYETDQIQTPFLPFGESGYIDGLKFDEFGNPLWYDVLHCHPGSTNNLQIDFEPEHVAADRMLHWFKLRRPGQHRGIPESASTLNLGAAFRRLREASLSTAEKVAAWTLFLKTQFQPDEMDQVLPMSTLDIVHGMMTSLPNSVEPHQLQAEQPGPNYDTFHRTLLNEQARPKNMPFNKAACARRRAIRAPTTTPLADLTTRPTTPHWTSIAKTETTSF
jgi:capsid protein